MLNKYIYAEATQDYWPQIKSFSAKSYNDCVEKLILQYGSIENIYDNIQTLSDDMQEKFLSHKTQLLLYKKLATICLDVPLEFKCDDFIKKNFHKQELQKIFAQLEFASLLKELNTIQEDKQAVLFDI